MEVKKFEAESLRQAIQMVKNELGPDAVILSTKDVARGYNNRPYVIVTAAISENKLQKKRIAEKKWGGGNSERFRSAPAAKQRQIIEHVYETEVEKYRQRNLQPTQKPYAFIEDEVAPRPPANEPSPVVFAKAEDKPLSSISMERIKSAAQEAFNVNIFSKGNNTKPAANVPSEQINELRSEIQRLQSMIKTMGSPTPQTLHPGAKYGIPYEASFMFEKLKREGLSETIIVKILKKMSAELSPTEMSKKSMIESYIARWILSDVTIMPHTKTERIEVLLGPSGSGKTSTLVKMASQYIVKEKKRVAVISTDVYKVGALEQLKIYCQILNIPFAAVKSTDELELVMKQLHSVDKILIDTPGMSLKEVSELNWLRTLVNFSSSTTKHLVLSALSKDEDLLLMTNRFKTAQFNDFIFTGIDQAIHHGQIINLNQMFAVPVHSFGTGKLIPENFEWATKERILDLMFKLSRISKEGDFNGSVE